MALFPQPFIDDLRLQTNIVSVVQEFVPLKKIGRTYKGLCPFHSEKTPSFHVDPEKGFFHCFGCGAGGDVFKFLELHEKLGFVDAVKLLAQRVGLELPEQSGGLGGSTGDAAESARRDAALREALLKIHDIAAAYFREQLAAPEGTRARRQLEERDLTQATIEQLGLGYAPRSRDGLNARLLAAGFSQATVVQSGLAVQRDSGEIVDRFRHRLMVPICRETGSVIAFGGRQMEADQGGPKYLNSPETPIYSKSRTLYGLHLCRHSITKAGFAVLVEGYFDFAQLLQSRAAPAVASCGTALTAAQARLLRRFTSKVVLSFDADDAGQGAAARSCDLLVAEGFDVNVLVLNRGEDPDTFIRRHGPDRYRERLRGSRPYLEYLADRASEGLDFRNDESRRRFLNNMLGVAARIPDAAVRDQFADRVAHKARITEEVVRAEIRKAAAARRTTVGPASLPGELAQAPSGRLKEAEKALIWALIHNTEEALEAVSGLDPEDLEYLAGRDIFELARRMQRDVTAPDAPVERSLGTTLLPSAFLQRLSTVNAQLVTSIAAGSVSPARPADSAIALKRLRWERERAAIQREIDRLQQLGATQHGHEIDDLWQRKKDLLHRLEQLT